MKGATIIYPHQLFSDHPALQEGCPVYLIEESLLLTYNPIHRQKLILHKLSLDAYEKYLVQSGYDVTRVTISDCPTTKSVFEKIKTDGIKKMHVADTTDSYLEKAITDSDIERVWYESPLFLLEKQNSVDRFKQSNRYMSSFYKQLRKDKNILIDEDGDPVGGKWSFDEDNRKKIPGNTELPKDISFYGNADTKEAESWVQQVEAEKYGESGCWLPYTHEGAQKFLQEFLRTRFSDFGTYEDAMTTEGVRLWHSTLSPLLNIGLLTPDYVLNEAISYAATNDIPINSLEGFVRQILGWREFIRASYECDGSKMRNDNFFKHSSELSDSFWTGTTNIAPVDHAIESTLEYGYNHHIERLMILGNFMLLSQIDPNHVYHWFMGMYVDAYDWVMVPNVYGMSQFADGGSFATKPYISGANYVKKMSDFPSGNWENIWTALYWDFISKHRTVFENNHRLSMMPKMLDRMSEEKQQSHLDTAQKYLANKR